MFIKRSLLAISVSLVLAGCGGSGGSAPAAATPTPTPSPTPAPTPAPVTTSVDGVFSGKANLDEAGTTADVVGVVSSDMSATLMIGNMGALLKVSLTTDGDGNVEAEGMSYSESGDGAVVIVSGKQVEGEFSLEVAKDGQKQYDFTLAKDDVISNYQPVVDGYYELDTEGYEKAAVVLSDGTIEGNDTGHCKYSGSYQVADNNVLDISLTVSSIEPEFCSLQGEYQGLATALSAEMSDNGKAQLLFAVDDQEQAIVRPLAKASDEAEFVRFPPGLYYQDSATEFEDLSFAVSHDGEVRGAIVNKLFGGYFNATPDYMGKGFSLYDSYVLYYERSVWHTTAGNLLITDNNWERLFEKSDEELAQREQGDFVDIVINVTDDPVYTGNTSMAVSMQKRESFPIQFTELVGRYVVEGANIDLSISADGTISGTHHGCGMTGEISERTDTAAQEFTVTFTRTECPGSNSFSLDGDYEGFGLATNYPDEGYSELNLFMSGQTSLGQVTNLLSLNSLTKQ